MMVDLVLKKEQIVHMHIYIIMINNANTSFCFI